jgi:hypothetical protein
VYAVLHRTYRSDVAGRAAQHVFGLGAYGDNDFAAPTGLVLHRDDGRLVEHDALVADVDECVGRAEIDRQITGKIAAEAFEHEATGKCGGGPPKWRVI